MGEDDNRDRDRNQSESKWVTLYLNGTQFRNYQHLLVEYELKVRIEGYRRADLTILVFSYAKLVIGNGVVLLI